MGVINLSYRGNSYHFFNGKVSTNPVKKTGVTDSPMQYQNGVINLGLNEMSHLVSEMSKFEVDEHITGLIMAHQYSLKKGIQLFGNRAEEATVKELKQIHDMDTYTPLDPKTLSQEEKNKALSALLFLAAKRDGRLKAYKCAVGSK